ncbi:phosphatidylinositol-4-phosphate 5-kinase family protein [Cryptosporidium serpentis]
MKIYPFFLKSNNYMPTISKSLILRIRNEKYLSIRQIKDLYKVFKHHSDGGFIGLDKFRVLLGLLDDGILSQLIFNAMDLNRDNKLDFYELCKAMGIMISGTDDEKMEFSYRIAMGVGFGDKSELRNYNITESDGITFDQLLTLVRVIDGARYSLAGPHISTYSDNEIYNVFKKFATLSIGTNEPKIYLNDYKYAIKESVEFLSLFGISTPYLAENLKGSLGINGNMQFYGSNIIEETDHEYITDLPLITRSLKNTPLDSITTRATTGINSNLFDSITLSNQTSSILSNMNDIKNGIEETLRSIQDVKNDETTCNKNETNIDLNIMTFSYKCNRSEELIKSEKFNDLFWILYKQIINIKAQIENQIELLNNLPKNNIQELKKLSKLPPSACNISTFATMKMYINKGNVLPITHNRLSAIRIIKNLQIKSKNTHKKKFKLDNKENFSIKGWNMNKRTNRASPYNLLSNDKISNSFAASKHNLVNREMIKGYRVHFGHGSWNTVLNMMIGMRLAMGRIYSEPNRNVAEYDFLMKEKFVIIPRMENILQSKIARSFRPAKRFFTKRPVQFIDYNPMVFRKIREICNISPESYIRSVGPEQLLGNMVLGNLSSMNELCSEGKSGAFFYYSADGRFVIKTVNRSTAIFFRRILRDYYRHLESNSDSLITKIYGLHALRFKKPLFTCLNSVDKTLYDDYPVLFSREHNKIYKVYFIVMCNIFHTPVEIHRRYDLKGSWIGRYTPIIHQTDQTIALKDMDMVNKDEFIQVDEKVKQKLLDQVTRDCQFLQSHHIMDYSLLLGIHYVDPQDEDNIKNIGANMELQDFVGAISTDKKKIYYFGIIDFFTTWTTIKKVEKLYKTVILGSSTGISAIKPEAYATRFIQFLISRISLGV